jgi:hypothetical protein
VFSWTHALLGFLLLCTVLERLRGIFQAAAAAAWLLPVLLAAGCWLMRRRRAPALALAFFAFRRALQGAQ